MPKNNNWQKPKSARLIPGPGEEGTQAHECSGPASCPICRGKDATKTYAGEAVRLLGMISGALGSPVLTDNDRGFVADMKAKMDQYRSGFVCSQRQVFWLRSIKDRLVERGEI